MLLPGEGGEVSFPLEATGRSRRGEANRFIAHPKILFFFLRKGRLENYLTRPSFWGGEIAILSVTYGRFPDGNGRGPQPLHLS